MHGQGNHSCWWITVRSCPSVDAWVVYSQTASPNVCECCVSSLTEPSSRPWTFLRERGRKKMVSERKRLEGGEGRGTSGKMEGEWGKGEGGISAAFWIFTFFLAVYYWILFTGNVYMKTCYMFLCFNGHREAEEEGKCDTVEQGSHPQSHYSLFPSVAMRA